MSERCLEVEAHDREGLVETFTERGRRRWVLAFQLTSESLEHPFRAAFASALHPVLFRNANAPCYAANRS